MVRISAIADTATAGVLGAEATDCDTPSTLVDATFQWIKDNVKDEIDFVIWTGDSARHDNDERYPRSNKQVEDQNKMLVDKMFEVFGKPDNLDDPDPTNDFVVPIVPTFGNNDILPHNIFEPGPNRWTRTYESIWQRFIPEVQKHSFARGGWFFTEVIPNKLAVFSLNSLYFFDNNAAVDGCASRDEPGYEHFEWLRIQLQFLRDRGMKAILVSHVPPARTDNKQNWDESCWQKYTLWLRQYRDVIVSSMYGHMNIDHFMIQDDHRINIEGLDLNKITARRTKQDPMFSAASKAEYMNDLRSEFVDLPKPPSGMSYAQMLEEYAEMRKEKKTEKQKAIEKFIDSIGGAYAERFSLSLVSPSVVPNYFPTLRLVEYNISGLEDHHPAQAAIGNAVAMPILDSHDYETDDEDTLKLEELTNADHDCDHLDPEQLHDLKKKKKKKKHPKVPFHVPQPPSKSAPPGPAYSPQTFTLLSYRQLFANLTRLNADFQSSKITIGEFIGSSMAPSSSTKHKKHRARFEYELEYDTRNDTLCKMEDLTVRSYLNMAERMSRRNLKLDLGVSERKGNEGDTPMQTQRRVKKHKNALWHAFVKRAFVLTKDDKQVDEEFG